MKKEEMYFLINEIHEIKSHLQHIEYKLVKEIMEVIYNE